MALSSFHYPTEHRSARMNIQLAQLLISNRLCCVRISRALRAHAAKPPEIPGKSDTRDIRGNALFSADY